jgi:hypothetical protein
VGSRTNLRSYAGPQPNQPCQTLAAATPVSGVVVQLPNNAESLIQSVTVTTNGQNLDAGPGNLYNQLFNLISDVQMGGKKNERAISQLGADVPAITYPIVPGQGGAPPTGGYQSQVAQPSSSQFGNILPVPTIYTSVVGGTGTSNPGTFDGNNQQVLAISNWLGFLSSTEVIDTDLLGDVRVSITLADTNVLVIDNYSTDYKTIGYSLNRLYFTVNTINLSPECIRPRPCSWRREGSFKGNARFGGRSRDQSCREPNSLLHRSLVPQRPYQECIRNPSYPVKTPLKLSTSLWHPSPWIC